MKNVFKFLFLIFVLAANVRAQSFSYQNFSQFADGHVLTGSGNYSSGDGLVLARSWSGSGAATMDRSWSAIINQSNALSVESGSRCGADPPGHSGKYLTYDVDAAQGSGNNIIFLGWPANASAPASAMTFYFCTTIPKTVRFGTSGDMAQVIGGPSRLSNYWAKGGTTQEYIDIEGGTNPATRAPVTENVWIKVVQQFVDNAACTDTAKFTDCIVVRTYNVTTGALMGTAYSAGGTGTCNTIYPVPCYLNLGNGNVMICSTGGSPPGTPCTGMGYKIQYGDVRIYNLDYTSDMLDSIGGISEPLWTGILNPKRAFDYAKVGTTAGNAGPLPSDNWTQCTLYAGAPAILPVTSTAAEITAALAACGGTNTFVPIASGTYPFSIGQIAYPTSGHVTLRAIGDDGADFVFSGTAGGQCGSQESAFICAVGGGSANPGGTPTLTWTGGYAKNSVDTFLSSVAGINTISAANPTLLIYNQCDTGYSVGVGCTSGTNTDNGNLFVGNSQYNAADGSGCCKNSGGGNTITRRGEAEIHVASAVDGATNKVTLMIPITNPNYVSGSAPMVLAINSISTIGLENIRIKDPTVARSSGILLRNAYNWWLKGVAIMDANHNLTHGFSCWGCANGEMQTFYIFKIQGYTTSYGIRCFACSYNLFANGLIQQTSNPEFRDGSSTGNVFADVFVPNAPFPSPDNTTQPAFESHAVNSMDYFEQILGMGETQDGIKGTGFFMNNFRDGYFGYWSQFGLQITLGAFGRQDTSYSRYNSDLFGLYGHSMFHTFYEVSATCTNWDKAIFALGQNCLGSPAIPGDPKVKTTSLRYGNYDTKRAGIGYCADSKNTNWSTICASTSEIPELAPMYPNFKPTKGDTAIGQPPAPPSFIWTVRPAWYLATIPFPAMGPDVSGGNLGQCGGTLATRFGGSPATNASQCGGQSLNQMWAGHAHAIPMAYYALSVLNMPPDGSGAELNFRGSYFTTGGPPPPGQQAGSCNENLTTTASVTAYRPGVAKKACKP